MDRLVRARVLVAEAAALGLTIEDLVAASTQTPRTSPAVPTVAEYLAVIIPTFTKGTLRTYRSYWRLAEAQLGDRPIDIVGVDDCEAVLAAAVRRAQRQRPGSDARSPRENCVAALRALFGRAERARLILHNPAANLDKPRRLPNRRRALSDDELSEAVDAVRTTSRDPDLDLLLVRFHLESGARQEGALHLTLDDIDRRRSTVWLREKFGSGSRECARRLRRASVSCSQARAVRRDAGLSGTATSPAGLRLTTSSRSARAHTARTASTNASSAPMPWRAHVVDRASSPARRAHAAMSAGRTVDASRSPAQSTSRLS